MTSKRVRGVSWKLIAAPASMLIDKLNNNKLIIDSTWSLIGNSVGKGLALIAGIVIARLLGKDVFGEYEMTRSTIIIIGSLSTFGMGYTATKYVASYIDKPELIAAIVKFCRSATLTISGISSITLFIFSDAIAKVLFEASYLSTPLRLLSILVVFNAFTAIQIGALSGLGNYRLLAAINISVGLLTFTLSTTLTYIWGFIGALTALIIVQAVNCLLNSYFLNRSLPKASSPENHRKLQREILRFTTPIALQEITYYLIFWLGHILIIRVATFGQLGLYAAAMQWNAIVLFIPGILRNVILFHMSKSSSDLDAQEQILKQVILINLISTAIPVLIVVIFSKYLAATYGDTFEGLSKLISLAVFLALFSSVSNVYAQAYMAAGKNWIMLLFRIMRDAGSLICFLIMIWSLSYDAALLLILSSCIFNILFVLVISYFYHSVILSKRVRRIDSPASRRF